MNFREKSVQQEGMKFEGHTILFSGHEFQDSLALFSRKIVGHILEISLCGLLIISLL
jgi:hypothetical protein